jgi:lysophospholipase L1-like esterase
VLRFDQNPQPKVLIVSPIHFGEGIRNDEVNYEMFDYEHGIETSKKLAFYYKNVADKYGCEFLDAAEFAEPSKEDSVHMTPEGHKKLGEAIAKKIEYMLKDQKPCLLHYDQPGQND